MVVGGELASWQEGRALVFDDTYVHSVRHSGLEARQVEPLIHILDIIRHITFHIDDYTVS